MEFFIQYDESFVRKYGYPRPVMSEVVQGFLKCGSEMKIISFINEVDVIRKILEHLGLWEEKTPKERAPPIIRKKGYEPSDDGRSLPLVAYLAAVRGDGHYSTLILFVDEE